MASPDLRRPEFRQLFTELGLDDATLRQPVASTFIPNRLLPPEKPLIDSLPRLALADGSEEAPELELTEVLGEGGRGEVRNGRQLALRRDVAVKSIKGELGPSATTELLREARITGGLEHPNVVPVYTLGRDASGRVMLVMKRVEGEPWGKILRREGRAQTDEQLERHLEIFRQVCHAVEFAHQRGIVHRDLKPDNVMVGSFGEVVVLDWGLAVSIDGDPVRGLPPAREVRGLAGTPAYMAPEMVGGEGTSVGRWTDVYLLGAILHEIVAGAPPHQGATLSEVLERAYESRPPSYDGSVPAELAAICQRAMHADPAQRYGSVSLLREAARDFLRHRQSSLLAEESMRRLEGRGPVPATLTAAEASARLSAVGQCRFGFEQALRTWAENPVAQRGLQRCLEGFIEIELAAGDLPAAQRLLTELASPRPDLLEKVRALEAKEQQSQAELEELRRMRGDLDVESGKTTRNLLLGITAVIWGFIPVSVGYMEKHGMVLSPRFFVLSALVFAILMAIALPLLRRKVTLNTADRRSFWTLLAAVAVGISVRGIGFLFDVPLHALVSFELLGYALVSVLSAIHLDTRFLFAGVVYTLGAVAGAIWQGWSYEVGGLANLLALMPIAVAWDHLRKAQLAMQCELTANPSLPR